MKARINVMGFWLKPGKKYGKQSKLIKKLNHSSHTDEITGMEVWKGLRVNVYDDFVTLSGRYVVDDSKTYSFRFALEGSAKLKKIVLDSKSIALSNGVTRGTRMAQSND